MPAPLILASTSPYRRALLERLGRPFQVVAPGVDEGLIAGESPAARSARLALAKARAVSSAHPDAWVLGSDQVADCDGRILEKPGNAERCRAQLALCSGRSATFFTAAVLARGQSATVSQHVDRTVVRFRLLSAEEIDSYVKRDRPYDCAGGFRCEGLGIALFEGIDASDPTALIGLPMIWVAGALRQAGLDPLAQPQS
ncbi:MAG: Maf family nucleotide pyrophosphatase [Gammaproteobacteria bacterium]|nr:Maf family nucleotide pyrophosphatase [Gammaproteobacteria bacterium]